MHRPENVGTGHKLICASAVIKKAKHCITVDADGIVNTTTMTAGNKDQPVMRRGVGIGHQLWDATTKGTATR